MNFQGEKVVKGKTVTPIKYESVAKYMTKRNDLITFYPDQEIIEVIETILERKISGSPVLNKNDEMIGMITEKHCLKLLIDASYHNEPISKGLVGDYMTTEYYTIHIDADIIDAANKFFTLSARRLPVIDDHGVLKGQISRRDVLKAAKALKGSTW